MVVAVPVLWWLMPFLMGLAYGTDFRVHATTPRGSCSSPAALQLVWGWTKSFPVSIGRPGLRVDRRRAIEIAVFVPLLLVVRLAAGARPGAAGAMLVSTVRLLRRLVGRCCCGCAPAGARAGGCRATEGPRRLRDLAARRRRAGVARARGGGVPARARPRGRGRDHRRRGSRRREALPGALGARARCRPGVRHARGRPAASRARARRADVVYTTGMLGRSSLGALARPDAVRDQADRRPRLRARAALGALARLARGVPDASRRRRDAAAAPRPRPRRAPRRARRDARRRTCASSRSAGASRPTA